MTYIYIYIYIYIYTIVCLVVESQGIVGCQSYIETLAPAFETGIQHRKPFAQNWYLPCRQCTETSSHASSVQKKYIHRGPGPWSSRMKVWCVTPRLFSHMIKPCTILELAAMLILLRSCRLMITIHISWYACPSVTHLLVIRKNQKWFMDIPGVHWVPCIH